MDSSTDSSISENDAVFVVYFDLDKMTVKTSYLKLVFLQASDAEGVLQSIDDTFKSIVIENFYENLVSFGANGASVNGGNKERVEPLLRKTVLG